jgi:environmental stress-induced protein Ves
MLIAMRGNNLASLCRQALNAAPPFLGPGGGGRSPTIAHEEGDDTAGPRADGTLCMTESAVHLRRDQYRSMPWRNGSGVTLEIAREAAADSEFLWRLSLATVANSGPFSSYPGYRRSVSLIAGNGFRLDIGGREPAILDSVGATALFSGGDSTGCTLIDGRSTDLSLIVREPGTILSVARIQDTQGRVVPLRSGTLNALFCLSEGACLTLSGAAGPSSRARAEATLAVHDTVLLGAEAAEVAIRPTYPIPVDLLLLTWTAENSARS